MKRTITLLAFCGFFLSLAFGYYFTVQEQEKYRNTAEEEEAITAAKKEVTVKKDGELTYQYFYTKDAITKEKKNRFLIF